MPVLMVDDYDEAPHVKKDEVSKDCFTLTPVISDGATDARTSCRDSDAFAGLVTDVFLIPEDVRKKIAKVDFVVFVARW